MNYSVGFLKFFRFKQQQLVFQQLWQQLYWAGFRRENTTLIIPYFCALAVQQLPSLHLFCRVSTFTNVYSTVIFVFFTFKWLLSQNDAYFYLNGPCSLKKNTHKKRKCYVQTFKISYFRYTYYMCTLVQNRLSELTPGLRYTGTVPKQDQEDSLNIHLFLLLVERNSFLEISQRSYWLVS